MEVLADHYATRRNTSRGIEIAKIRQSESIRKVSAKHKWYLKDRYGMIKSLLVPDYYSTNISSVIGMLAITTLMCRSAIGTNNNRFNHKDISTSIPFYLIIIIILWRASTHWVDLIDHDGWKVLTDHERITQRLIQRNSTHLSMSGESPFARGPLAADIGLDGEGDAVEDILKGKYKRDLSGLDEASTSSEMKNFIKVLKILISLKTGKSLEPMLITYKHEDYVE